MEFPLRADFFPPIRLTADARQRYSALAEHGVHVLRKLVRDDPWKSVSDRHGISIGKVHCIEERPTPRRGSSSNNNNSNSIHTSITSSASQGDVDADADGDDGGGSVISGSTGGGANGNGNGARACLMMCATIATTGTVSEVLEAIASPVTDDYRRAMAFIYPDRFLDGICLHTLTPRGSRNTQAFTTIKWAAFNEGGPIASSSSSSSSSRRGSGSITTNVNSNANTNTTNSSNLAATLRRGRSRSTTIGTDYCFLEHAGIQKEAHSDAAFGFSIQESISRDAEVPPMPGFGLSRGELHRTGILVIPTDRRDTVRIASILQMDTALESKPELLEKRMRARVGAVHRIALLLDRRRLSRLPLLPRARWIKDESRRTCAVCLKAFGALRRKHHCRHCGDVVCATCAPPHTVDAPTASGSACIRICTACVVQSRRVNGSNANANSNLTVNVNTNANAHAIRSGSQGSVDDVLVYHVRATGSSRASTNSSELTIGDEDPYLKLSSATSAPSGDHHHHHRPRRASASSSDSNFSISSESSASSRASSGMSFAPTLSMMQDDTLVYRDTRDLTHHAIAMARAAVAHRPPRSESSRGSQLSDGGDSIDDQHHRWVHDLHGSFQSQRGRGSSAASERSGSVSVSVCGSTDSSSDGRKKLVLYVPHDNGVTHKTPSPGTSEPRSPQEDSKGESSGFSINYSSNSNNSYSYADSSTSASTSTSRSTSLSTLNDSTEQSGGSSNSSVGPDVAQLSVIPDGSESERIRSSTTRSSSQRSSSSDHSSTNSLLDLLASIRDMKADLQTVNSHYHQHRSLHQQQDQQQEHPPPVRQPGVDLLARLPEHERVDTVSPEEEDGAALGRDEEDGMLPVFTRSRGYGCHFRWNSQGLVTRSSDQSSRSTSGSMASVADLGANRLDHQDAGAKGDHWERQASPTVDMNVDVDMFASGDFSLLCPETLSKQKHRPSYQDAGESRLTRVSMLSGCSDVDNENDEENANTDRNQRGDSVVTVEAASPGRDAELERLRRQVDGLRQSLEDAASKISYYETRSAVQKQVDSLERQAMELQTTPHPRSRRKAAKKVEAVASDPVVQERKKLHQSLITELHDIMGLPAVTTPPRSP